MEAPKALILRSVPVVICLELGSGLEWYQANLTLWQSSLLPGELWEDRGCSKRTRYAQAIRVCYDLSLLFLSLSEPLLGYYKPDVLGIVLESETGPNRKKV